MPFELFRLFGRKLLSDGGKDFLFGHCVLTLSWNLMCSTSQTLDLQYSQITWFEDALRVHLNERPGSKPRNRRHIYANPCMPEICPILSTCL